LYLQNLNKKLIESLQAVCPIMLLVLLLAFIFVPVPAGTMLAYLFGGVMLILGMMFFNLGAELSMETMGEQLGAKITKTKKLYIILPLAFLLGLLITISEPDLQVLANQVASIPSTALIFTIAIGVGLFLVCAFLRMVLRISLQTMLIISYGILIILSFFVPKDFLAVAYDAGGVTTGPMTVPFIMSFGVGIAAIRSDSKAADDSFGLVALCSVGPILAVMILAFIYKPEDVAYSSTWIPDVEETIELGRLFLHEIPTYLKEMAIALLPIVAFFGVFQLFTLKISGTVLHRIGTGLIYTYLGLVLFLTGVNVGFLPMGSFLGQRLAEGELKLFIIPIGMIIGFFIVKAEPAIYVLMRQVEEITSGAIKGKTLQITLCISVAISIGLSLLRVLTGIPIYYFIIPGYVIALGLSFAAPKIFSAIAYDAGGVASGPMTTTFLLPFAMGACISAGGNVVTDAFGLVAMVALTPLIAIQVLGIVFKLKTNRATNEQVELVQEDADWYTVIDL